MSPRARVGDRPIRTRVRTVRLGVGLSVIAWLARRTARAAAVVCKTPAALMTLAVLTGLVWLALLVDVSAALTAAVFGQAGLIIWWRQRRQSFLRWVGGPVWSCGRDWLRYRPRWSAGMKAAGLTHVMNGRDYAPELLGVTSTASVDRVRVRMLAGQTLEDYAEEAPGLAQTFGASVCRVRSVPRRVHELELWLLVRDPLRRVVEPLPVGADPFLTGLPVARVEDGSVWRLRLVGSHVLVVGATGAGKGSVIWSLLLQLAPSIRVGLVKVWAVDPKGGMELAAGRPLFDRFCHGDSDTATGYETSFAELLDDAVTVMRRRQDRLRGVTRLHEPSTAEPLVVLVIDELAALTGWALDRTAKRRMEAALGLLLSQGRAVGVVVVGAVQDPRKDVLPMRDLFPTRIALRLNEAEQVSLVLGPGARNRGAFADQIPESLPGVGYVAVDGIAEPVRVRFSHITDDTIRSITAAPKAALVNGAAA